MLTKCMFLENRRAGLKWFALHAPPGAKTEIVDEVLEIMKKLRKLFQQALYMKIWGWWKWVQGSYFIKRLLVAIGYVWNFLENGLTKSSGNLIMQLRMKFLSRTYGLISGGSTGKAVMKVCNSWTKLGTMFWSLGVVLSLYHSTGVVTFFHILFGSHNIDVSSCFPPPLFGVPKKFPGSFHS